MPARYEYGRTLGDDPRAADDSFPGMRRPASSDAEGLAELMLDAYRGTIDYDGETLDDSRSEIASYFDESDLPPLPQYSWVLATDEIIAACLVSYWPARDRPLIAYVMTRALAKGQGYAARLVVASLRDLAEAGYAEARAVITEGNTPSERLFARLGFQRVAG